MIIMGAGICQWFHGDATYRAVLSLLLQTGSMGRNGGGWAHYVGQEKCRPLTGWLSLANGLDWSRPPRTMTGTSYWYMHTDQWRFDGYRADALASPLAEGHLAGMHTADTIAQSARLGWMPFYPQFDRNPLDLADEAVAAAAAGAADTQARPVPVITSPEWSGSETGGRRYAPFTINVERLKPWHTLTGRMHFFLDHDWMRDLGEALPIYRPPLDLHRLLGEPTLGPDGTKQVAVRYLTPHSKWSIHSEYQDNLLMLALSRGGPTCWLSPADAAAIEAKDNDWIECVNANGVFVCRAVVSHRMPEGVVYVHHAQERTIDVPKSERTGRRGGIHNSITRLLVKPTHLIGGYAQLSYTFNYLGPTGNQRDIVTTIRRRSQEVRY
jgi:nitrate reductase alpha subunit